MQNKLQEYYPEEIETFWSNFSKRLNDSKGSDLYISDNTFWIDFSLQVARAKAENVEKKFWSDFTNILEEYTFKFHPELKKVNDDIKMAKRKTKKALRAVSEFNEEDEVTKIRKDTLNIRLKISNVVDETAQIIKKNTSENIKKQVEETVLLIKGKIYLFLDDATKKGKISYTYGYENNSLITNYYDKK